MTKKISRYPVPQLNELPEDVQAILNGAKEKFGFVPNVVKALSHRPEQLRAFLVYNDTLTAKDTSLTTVEKRNVDCSFFC